MKTSTKSIQKIQILLAIFITYLFRKQQEELVSLWTLLLLLPTENGKTPEEKSTPPTGNERNKVTDPLYEEERRFITEDPIKDGLNWYGYVSNNPMVYIDPTGLWMDYSDQTAAPVQREDLDLSPITEYYPTFDEMSDNFESITDSPVGGKNVTPQLAGTEYSIENVEKKYGLDFDKDNLWGLDYVPPPEIIDEILNDLEKAMAAGHDTTGLIVALGQAANISAKHMNRLAVNKMSAGFWGQVEANSIHQYSTNKFNSFNKTANTLYNTGFEGINKTSKVMNATRYLKKGLIVLQVAFLLAEVGPMIAEGDYEGAAKRTARRVGSVAAGIAVGTFAAKGAVAGFALGGPVGSAIGAGVGLIVGFFTSLFVDKVFESRGW